MDEAAEIMHATFLQHETAVPIGDKYLVDVHLDPEELRSRTGLSPDEQQLGYEQLVAAGLVVMQGFASSDYRTIRLLVSQRSPSPSGIDSNIISCIKEELIQERESIGGEYEGGELQKGRKAASANLDDLFAKFADVKTPPVKRAVPSKLGSRKLKRMVTAWPEDLHVAWVGYKTMVDNGHVRGFAPVSTLLDIAGQLDYLYSQYGTMELIEAMMICTRKRNDSVRYLQAIVTNLVNKRKAKKVKEKPSGQAKDVASRL